MHVNWGAGFMYTPPPTLCMNTTHTPYDRSLMNYLT